MMTTYLKLEGFNPVFKSRLLLAVGLSDCRLLHLWTAVGFCGDDQPATLLIYPSDRDFYQHIHFSSVTNEMPIPDSSLTPQVLWQ